MEEDYSIKKEFGEMIFERKINYRLLEMSYFNKKECNAMTAICAFHCGLFKPQLEILTQWYPSRAEKMKQEIKNDLEKNINISVLTKIKELDNSRMKFSISQLN